MEFKYESSKDFDLYRINVEYSYSESSSSAY